MTGPLVSIGVLLHYGHERAAATLECIRTQTYGNLDVAISMDGHDDAVVGTCKPFLADPRFRMHVHPSPLGWAGSADWTLRNRRGEFYVYLQHDDTISPTYVADLVDAAARWPQAAVCYAMMAFSGRETTTIRHKPNLDPDPIRRALTHIERLDTSPLRGLIRGSAIDTTSGIRANDFNGRGSEHTFMAELALAGEFRFVAGPVYHRRLDLGLVHIRMQDWPQERQHASWIAFAAQTIEAIVPRGRTLDERRRLFDIVLERFLMARGWASRLVPWAIDRLRGWTVNRERLTYHPIDNRDAKARAARLRAILERLRSNGRFDPAATLASDWDAIEDAARRRFR